ncbi:MAG: glycosyl transferase family 2 [Planctomycetota bacterium]|nr:MAG: glycosyl transferase family 2 [Planctomycetota bacterium]
MTDNDTSQKQPQTPPPGRTGGKDPRTYVVITPCRNEEDYMRRTLDSVIAQTEPPTLWVIVDDGSTDGGPEILADYATRYPWIRVITKPDRGNRAVGPGVIEAFYYGYERINPEDYTYSCKLDLDLELPPTYFATLMDRMEADPRLGTCSGKACTRVNGELVSEGRGDEMSCGMSKFQRRTCFENIGGYVREVMWDAIDCHTARYKGWRAASWDEPELRVDNLRPMGTSQGSVYNGRRRHGFGQWFMGSDPLYYTASCILHMFKEKPYILGGLAMWWGYVGSWLRRVPQYDNPELRAFIRAYQRRALIKGKAAAIAEQEAERAPFWNGGKKS